MVDTESLRELVNSQVEWLLVRESGRGFALTCNEITVYGNGSGCNLQFLDDRGTQTRTPSRYERIGGEVIIELAETSDQPIESIRLIPRSSAKELAEEMELARLVKANR